MGTNTTIVIGLAILVLAIFGSAWLNLRQIERMLESLRNELKAEIKVLEQQINFLDQKQEQRNESVTMRLSAMETRIERIERQLDSLYKPILK